MVITIISVTGDEAACKILAKRNCKHIYSSQIQDAAHSGCN